LNLRGEVIGINVAMAEGAENIGFAIPINRAKRDVESVKSTGKIVYPFMGIRYVSITKAIQEDRNLPVDYGVLLVEEKDAPAVVPESPADTAGLKNGDIILSIDGKIVDQSNTLLDILQDYTVGNKILLKVLREKQELSFELTLSERK